MDAKVQLTKDGLEKLKKELSELEGTRVPELRKRMDEARSSGDLSENTGWDLIQEEYNNAITRVQELKHTIKKSVLISSCNCSYVSLGSTVTILSDKQKKIYRIVPAKEANPLENKISDKSPLGILLVGSKVGDKKKYDSPNGKSTTIEVIKIDN